MVDSLEAVRPITLAEIRAARERIAGTIVRTPLVRLELGPDFPDIRLKLENLQPINAYKLRGAANAVAMLSDAERKRGVWTISAGNAGQGVAYAARAGGRAVHGRGDRDRAGREDRAHEGARREARARCPTMSRGRRSRSAPIPASKARSCIRSTTTTSSPATRTMGLEILEDAPDTAAVIAGIGGGGLITGVGSALKALKPDIKVWGAEPETAAPAALSLATGSPQPFKDWKASFVDGAGGQSVFPRMWERMKPVVDGCIVVTPGRDEARHAADGGKGARHRRRRRRLAARRRADRQGRSGTDRRHRLRRQHRPEEILRDHRLADA